MIHTKRSKPCGACPQRQEQNKQQIPWTHYHKGQRNASQRCKRAMVGWSSVRVWVGLVQGLVMMVISNDPYIHRIHQDFGASWEVFEVLELNFFRIRNHRADWIVVSTLVHHSSQCDTFATNTFTLPFLFKLNFLT